MKHPLVTVLMPVYNAEKFIAEATDSILEQTFPDFEFLIISDGSTDRSLEIIKSFHDSRIRIVSNRRNRGVIFSLNRGLRLAKGEYIARMDADDISIRNRLENQVSFLDAHPKVGICGSWTRLFLDGPGHLLFDQVLKFPNDSDTIKATMLFENILQHPSVMIRRSVLTKFGLEYPTMYPHIEDYGLWIKMAKVTDFAILDSVLLNYRLHANQVGQLHGQTQLESVRKAHLAQIHSLGIKPKEQEMDIHEKIAYGRYEPRQGFMVASETWLTKLQKANERKGIYNRQAFSKVLGKRWLMICLGCISLRGWVWRKFRQSQLSKFSSLSLSQWLRFWFMTAAAPVVGPFLLGIRSPEFRRMVKRIFLQ